MERHRVQQTQLTNTGRGYHYGTRAFGQELTNLKDLLRIGKDVPFSIDLKKQDLSRQKSTQRILSSRLASNYTSHAAVMNDVKERCTYRELPSNENRHQSIKSVDNQSKQKLSTRNEKFDSNNVWHHVVIEPLIKDKSLVKERPQSMHNQKRNHRDLINPTSQNYSMLKSIVSKESREIPSRNKSNNPTFHLNLSNLSLTYKLQNPKSTEVSHTTQYTTVRFNDLKTVMDSIDQKLFYNSDTLIDQIDKGYEKRPEYVSPYAHESFKYLYDIQKKYMPKPQYFDEQTDINKHMRCILLDWLVDVQQKFKMRCETLHLTVNIIDRYLSCIQIKRNRLQLIGVGAMLIASKTEEIYAPQVKDLSFMTEHAYSKQDIINTESQILQVLEFQLNAPTTYSFLSRYQTLAPLSIKHFFLSQFIVELQIIQTPLECLPSSLAAGAFYLIRKIKKYDPVWPKELILSSDFDEVSARNVAKQLCLVLQSSQQNNSPSYFQSVIKKYSQTKYHKVSILRTKQSPQLTQQTTSTVVHDTEM